MTCFSKAKNNEKNNGPNNGKEADNGGQQRTMGKNNETNKAIDGDPKKGEIWADRKGKSETDEKSRITKL